MKTMLNMQAFSVIRKDIVCKSAVRVSTFLVPWTSYCSIVFLPYIRDLNSPDLLLMKHSMPSSTRIIRDTRTIRYVNVFDMYILFFDFIL